jgi:hypothetical protein
MKKLLLKIVSVVLDVASVVALVCIGIVEPTIMIATVAAVMILYVSTLLRELAEVIK